MASEMNGKSIFLLGISAMVIASCADHARPSAPDMATISPQDFALVPCGPQRADAPCVLVIAGGKRILFGAPAGTATSLPSEELRQLDSVIVFSLRAKDIEGLGEIRNESWRAGRDAALLTVGPRGTLDVVDAINQVYEQADALRIVEEGIPRGGYDAAVLTGREAMPAQIIFDTGDVQVERLSDGYQVSYYASAAAILKPCSSNSNAVAPDRRADKARIICNGEAPDLSWPLHSTYFIVRHAVAE